MRRPLLLNPKVRAAAKSRFRPGLAELVRAARREIDLGEEVCAIKPARRALAKPVVVAILNAPIPHKETT